MGHIIIAVLVYAQDNERAALEAAHESLSRMCEELKKFDYFQTFDEYEISERWGKIPTALRIESDEGVKLMMSHFNETKKQVMLNMKTIRRAFQN